MSLWDLAGRSGDIYIIKMEFVTLALIRAIEKLTSVEQKLIAQVYCGGLTRHRFCRDQKMKRKDFDALEESALVTLKTLLAANQVRGIRDVL